MLICTSLALLTAAGAFAIGVPAAAGDSGPGRGGGGDDAAELEHDVEMDDFAFRPARKVVRRGELVVWKNSDRAPHNAIALATIAGKPAFRTRTGNKDARLTARAPRRAGTYRYLCAVHPRMRGLLVVR
jgi:plastocyanin